MLSCVACLGSARDSAERVLDLITLKGLLHGWLGLITLSGTLSDAMQHSPVISPGPDCPAGKNSAIIAMYRIALFVPEGLITSVIVVYCGSDKHHTFTIRRNNYPV